MLGVQIGNGADRFLNVRRESPVLKLVRHGGSTSLDRGRNDPIESLLNFLYFGFGHVLQVQQGISCRLIDPDQLVELEMKRARVTALCTLDEEHHQECHDGSSGIDDQLPRIGPAKERSRNCPDEDDGNRHDKRD